MRKRCIDFLLPQYCLHCKDKADNEIPLCRACQKRLPWNSREDPLYATEIKRQDYRQGIATFHYKSPIDQWINALKFQHTLHYAKLLGVLFTEKMTENEQLPELIIPIPLHRSRLCQRGFSQTIEIAKHIHHRTQIPIDRYSLRRRIATQPQSSLSAEARSDNIKDAFICTKAITARHVALFDDVITTGNTINAALKALKTQGIETIDIWCCARSAIQIESFSRPG